MGGGQTWLRRAALIYLQATLDKPPRVSVTRRQWWWVVLSIVPRTVSPLCAGKCLLSVCKPIYIYGQTDQHNIYLLVEMKDSACN